MIEPIRQTAKTLAWSLLGTTTLVAAHHQYRRQSQKDAKLMDYAIGVRGELVALTQACQAGLQAFKQSYAAPATNSSPEAIKSCSAAVSCPFDGQASLTSAAQTGNSLSSVSWVSGVAALVDGGYGVVGLDHERNIVWQAPMSERVHDIVVQPSIAPTVTINEGTPHREVVVMGRRPSEHFWVLDTATGQIRHSISAQADRHFYGHACYSLDGRQLFVTENDTLTLAGKIGVYDAQQNYQKVAEFDSHGIGPHELVMHPDGETLIIANGGIKTEKASREELNLESMRPSLVYLNCHDGTLLEQIEPEHNQMSVRHLAIHDNGMVMIGIQYQGPKHDNVPLVLTHSRGDSSFTALQVPKAQWHCFHQYIASVAIDSAHNLLCATSPIGGCAAVFDLTTRTLIDITDLPDCAGAAVINTAVSTDAGFIVSDGQGSITSLLVKPESANSVKDTAACSKNSREDQSANSTWQVFIKSVYHKMSFDNHLQAL
ncbi:DUF1513 domain-containing protein [Psychrobacter pygoscelis]|uniref:DUF1513 domain-containing protein n=1 Tax=Psychrobacter pygoscelis TaxID=2488563 RepID=UPI0010386421|nr:DUF1513 domain-containing protein [Psychrobacter pygoscelis]